jgi:hypothetical protein
MQINKLQGQVGQAFSLMPYSFWRIRCVTVDLEQKGLIMFQDGGILIPDMTNTLSPSSVL